MKKYIIDTNALISFVTDRNLEQQVKIAQLFEQAAQLKTFIFCHQHVLTEFIYVMDKVYRIPENEIRQMVADFIEMPGIEVVSEIDFPGVFALWPATITDFGDAVIASVCRSIKGSAIVTFDREFIDSLKLLKLNYQML